MKSSQSHSKFFVLAIRIGIAVLLCGLFTGVVLAAGLTDASVDDFSLGTGCYVSQADTGQVAGAVIIPPTVGSIFSGTTLESGWEAEPGSYLSNGDLIVNDGRAGTPLSTLYPPNRSLEFVATFRNIGTQHIGMAVNLDQPPWAIFSTGGDGSQLFVRSNNGTETSNGLTSSYLNTPHLYRIDWESDRVIYWIDGSPVMTHNVTINADMRPLMDDRNATPAISLAVNWIRMSAYAPSPCTYTSRIIDGGVNNAHWTNFDTTVALPADTSISFDVRAANSDIGSAAWVDVNSNEIDVTGRYVQYQAVLATPDSLVTPQLLSAVFTGLGPNAVTLTSISAAPTTSPSVGWLVASLSGTGLLLALYGYRQIRRRSQP